LGIFGEEAQMASRKKATKDAERPDANICPACGRKTGDGTAALLEKLLKKVEATLTSSEVKASVADYLRLLQFREEMKDDEQPKEIRVTWVDPAGTSESEG
jgi:hypothetical protein